MYTHIYLYTCIYIYIYVYKCLCVHKSIQNRVHHISCVKTGRRPPAPSESAFSRSPAKHQGIAHVRRDVKSLLTGCTAIPGLYWIHMLGCMSKLYRICMLVFILGLSAPLPVLFSCIQGVETMVRGSCVIHTGFTGSRLSLVLGRRQHFAAQHAALHKNPQAPKMR